MLGAGMKIVLVWVLTCLLWSTVWLFIKLGVRDIAPVSFAGIRLVLAVTTLLPVLHILRLPLPRAGRDLRLIAVTGVLLLGVNYGLVFWGAQHLSSGLMAVLQAATPAFGLVFARYYLPNERLTGLKVCALVVGTAGVAVICSNQWHIAGRLALAGSIAVVGGALCVAFAYVLIKAYGSHLPPAVLTGGQMLCGAIPLLLFGVITEGSPLTFRWTATAVVALLYLALVGSVAAFWLNYWLLQRLEATQVLFMSIMEPLLAILLGAIVLGESLAWRTIGGGVCILLSVGLIMSDHSARSQRVEG
jgi:drug/metabolite transporter (DMT)-like permease